MRNHLLISTFVLTTSFLQAQIVNVPDANFKAALLAHNPIIDLNNDKEIQESEAIAFNKDVISISAKNIISLTGIEAFVNLKGLYCPANQIISLDVTKNTALTSLDISSNKISNIDLSKNIALKSLAVQSNLLASLDLSNNTVLRSLIAYSNQLSTLDVSMNSNLRDISCYGNQISVLNLGTNSVLAYLVCSSNKLKTLDVSRNTSLIRIVCIDNNLTNLDVSELNSLSDLQCVNNPNLSVICINSTQLQFANTTFYTKDATAQWSTTCGTITTIEDGYIESTSKKIIKILTPLGQEIQPEQASDGLFIYQYSDGSTRKIAK